jgi:hypothetical protein
MRCCGSSRADSAIDVSGVTLITGRVMISNAFIAFLLQFDAS